MTKQRWAALGALLIASAALGGCMTGPRSTGYTYYAVPCGTSGAVEARPLTDDSDIPDSRATPPAEPNAVPSTPSDAAGVRSTAPTCVVPVSLARSSYRGTRYPYGGGYYGAPYYGSIGLGFYGGSGFGRSHGRLSHGFGHRVGAHHGRRH